MTTKREAHATACDECLTTLTTAIRDYFDLMYDCDTSRFERIFRSTAQLHGFRDGRMVVWSAEAYRDVLDRRRSPKDLGAARGDEILLVDYASTTQALVKVRLRIASNVFIDYLTWHRVEGRWLITSKGYHHEEGDGHEEGDVRAGQGPVEAQP